MIGIWFTAIMGFERGGLYTFSDGSITDMWRIIFSKLVNPTEEYTSAYAQETNID